MGGVRERAYAISGEILHTVGDELEFPGGWVHQRDTLIKDLHFRLDEFRGHVTTEEKVQKKNDVKARSELKKLKQEKESNQLKIKNFDNAFKSLDKLIESQIPDNSRKGVSYNDVPPSPAGLFSPLKLDLSNTGLEEFQQPEFEGYEPKTSNSVSEDISNEVKESPDAPLVKELVSTDKLEKKTVFPIVAKREFVRPKQ
nr:hypothetical protein [Tanacetum cinerariifolium]